MNLLKEETLAKKLITKGGIVYIFAFLIAPTGYFARILVSNTLTVGDVGIFYSIIGLITILSAYNDLGLTEALQYFLPKYRIKKKYSHYKTIWIYTFCMQAISGIVIGALLRFGADRLANYYFHEPATIHILKIFSIYFVAINFLQALSSVYIAFQDVLYDKIVETVKMYGMLIFTIIFWLTQSISLETFSYARLLGLSMGLALSIFLFIAKYAHTLRLGVLMFDKKLIKKQFSYAFRVFLGMNASTLLGQVDQQMIVVLLGPTYAGYYANYLSLFMLYGVFAFPLMGLLFPIMTELVTKKYHDKIIRLLQLLYKYFSVFGFAMGGFFIALGPVVSQVLYGDKFIYSGVLLSYVAGFIFLNILIAINFNVLAGMGKVKERVKVIAWGLLLNIVGNFCFIIIFGRGLPGAIGATVLSRILMFIMTLHMIRREYSFVYNRSFLLRNIIVIVPLSIGLWRWSSHYSRSGGISRFIRIGILAIFSLVYCGILMVYNYKSIQLLFAEVRNIGSAKKE